MRLRTLVLREIFERKSQLLTSFLAILLGITVIVSIQNITYYSKGAVEQEMDSLGANVLVLPKSATLQDYYNADLQSDTIPEEYVDLLRMSDIQGLDNISPKLSVPIQLQGKNFHLTGILPLNEFQAKKSWGGAGIFSHPVGCGNGVGMMESSDKRTLSRKKVIKTLERQRSPRGGRRRRRARAEGMPIRSRCSARSSTSSPCCRRPARWMIPASSPTCTPCRS